MTETVTQSKEVRTGFGLSEPITNEVTVNAPPHMNGFVRKQLITVVSHELNAVGELTGDTWWKPNIKVQINWPGTDIHETMKTNKSVFMGVGQEVHTDMGGIGGRYPGHDWGDEFTMIVTTDMQTLGAGGEFTERFLTSTIDVTWAYLPE